MELRHETKSGHPNRSFRLDVNLNDLLKNAPRTVLPPPAPPELLPEPEFPRRPALLRAGPAPGAPHMPQERHWGVPLVRRAMRGWLWPYVFSRVKPGEFHPIIAYLFTEWKCNLDCHYCWAFDNRVKGMTEGVARSTVDWLHDTGCRVLALMGGEPLLRPQFVHKVVSYAAKKGFWVYLPTNGRLLRPELIDRLADAGMAVVNLAVDVVDEKPGLPKALNRIRRQFEYLLNTQYRYGYAVFFNMNICRSNLDDIRQLTEIARRHRIATDYHINESPMLEQEHFQHQDGNSTFFTCEDWTRVDELVDWLIERNRSGYKMVNSIPRLRQMKAFLRGEVQEWNCRAGQNSMIVRVDGTLAPCFPMYSAAYDWGAAGAHRFEPRQLGAMKRECQPHCFSTLNHNLAYCYDDSRVIRWVARQARRGFQGISGSFD